MSAASRRRPVRGPELRQEVGLRTAGLHALLDVQGPPERQLEVLRQARRELDALIRTVAKATKEKPRCPK